MLRLAIIGDVHDAMDRLDRVLSWVEGEGVDACLLVGDLGRDPPGLLLDPQLGRAVQEESVRRVLQRVTAWLGLEPVWVPGNHDMPDLPPDLPGHNCDGQVVETAGLRVAGLGGAGPHRFGFPYEWSEQQAEASLRRSFAESEAVDIFLTHAPPAKCLLDRTHHPRHVGSHAVRDCLRRARPGLLLCGHIHEAWGIEVVDEVPCLNAGALGPPFEQDLIWIVDWDSGAPARIHRYRVEGSGERSVRVWEGL